jgi:mannose-6-phosphate isomerase-like protein (cupin superfamily)
MFETKLLPAEPDASAPDGADVRVLLSLAGGSMAHFSLAPDQTSVAVRHETVEELWYVVAGRGQMWRAHGGVDLVVDLVPGTCLTVPLGTTFQFRSDGDTELEVVGVTMPPWPVDRVEAFRATRPRWPATVPEGPGLGSAAAPPTTDA